MPVYILAQYAGSFVASVVVYIVYFGKVYIFNMKFHVIITPDRRQHIMLTCPCNVDPLILKLYIVILGLTGVYNFVFALKRDCGYPLVLSKNKKKKIN